MLAKLVGKMGVNIKAQGVMYKAVVQAVLLYGIEIWVVAEVMVTVMESFHQRIARWILGMTGDRYFSNKLVLAEAAGNIFWVRHREADLQAVYRSGEYGGI